MRIIIENADQNDFNELAKLARAGKINTFCMTDEERPQGDLISRSALKEAFKEAYADITFSLIECNDIIDNAPTVETFTFEDMQKAADTAHGYGILEGRNERPQVDCENCDYRKFTEKLVDGFVGVLNKYGITSVEQLSEILKGGDTV